jgi:phage baseplate assembly protein W
MAFKIKNIHPLDLKPQVAVGVSIPFNGPAVFNSTYTTAEQLKSNLINFFLTNGGERVFNPLFGASLRQKLFEQITDGTINEVKNSIEQSTKASFPNLTINNVEILQDPNNNSIFITINYSVPNFNIVDDISLNFSN